MPPSFKPYPKDYCHSQLFPANVFDLLPEDHECYPHREFFEQIDTSEVEAQHSWQGQRAYLPTSDRVDPDLRLQVRGVQFAPDREALPRGSGVLYIADRNCPNFRVLSEFQKDYEEFFRAGFKQTVP